MSSAGHVVQRLRSQISPLTAAVVALALLGALLGVLMAMGADRGAGAQPTPEIATVAIDLDQNGNTATNIGAGGAGIDPGDIQSAVGDTLTFDIVVDSVPSPGIFGVGLEVNYDPAIVEVTAVNRFGGPPSAPGQTLLQYSGAGAAPFGGNDPTPDTDGSFRADSVDLGGTNETGPGKVLDAATARTAIRDGEPPGLGIGARRLATAG